MKHLNLLKACAIIPALFAVNAANAQLVNCNLFLQGNYVEVGVNWNGAYGTSTAAPAGYHAYAPGAGALFNSVECGAASSADSARLGFVADPAKDGWTVGSPAFFGDYFVPGLPQEGWSIKADGIQADAWNQNDEVVAATTSAGASIIANPFVSVVYDSLTLTYDTTFAPLTGSNINYTNTGASATGMWQGMFDSIAITQVTTLDSGALYFTIQVTLTNLASTPRNNVYYMRTVDPDNEEPQTGTFATRNLIESQIPNTDNLVEVSAAGVTYADAYLALGANDLRAKSFIIKSGLSPAGSVDGIFAGDTANYLYGVGDSLTQDVGIGLIFNIGHLSSVDSAGAVDSALRTASATVPPNRAVLNFYYAFKHATVPVSVSNITKTNVAVYPNPVKNEVNITNITTTDHIKLFDMMGRAVDVNWNIAHDGTNTFSTGSLAPGMYILQVSDQQGNPKSKTPLQKL